MSKQTYLPTTNYSLTKRLILTLWEKSTQLNNFNGSILSNAIEESQFNYKDIRYGKAELKNPKIYFVINECSGSTESTIISHLIRIVVVEPLHN